VRDRRFFRFWDEAKRRGAGKVEDFQPQGGAKRSQRKRVLFWGILFFADFFSFFAAGFFCFVRKLRRINEINPGDTGVEGGHGGFEIFLLRVLPDLRASAVILFKWAAKSGDYLGILFLRPYSPFCG
jgi:hypothetical protein